MTWKENHQSNIREQSIRWKTSFTSEISLHNHINILKTETKFSKKKTEELKIQKWKNPFLWCNTNSASDKKWKFWIICQSIYNMRTRQSTKNCKILSLNLYYHLALPEDTTIHSQKRRKLSRLDLLHKQLLHWPLKSHN